MNHKKRVLIFGIFFILSIQILLLLNNRQKVSFRYFIWNVKEVSIGRLICISFITGLSMSFILNKSLYKDDRTYQKDEEEDGTNFKDDFLINNNENNESYEIPPERDIRDSQPTISVNYRVIKDSRDNTLNNKRQTSRKAQDQDDWDNNDSEW